MKVKLEKNYRDYYTLSDLERAKTVINYMKEDTSTAKEYAEYAIVEALRDTGVTDREVITADAYTCRNMNAWNSYGEDTCNFDVWITALAETSEGYIKCGAYLTDIWQTGGDYHYKERMHIRRFKEVQTW